MKTLLILGSKPQPALPPRSGFDDLACANASGYSASMHGLPDPVYTVMTSLLASGIESGRQSLEVLRGLKTGKVYFLRRRDQKRGLLKGILYYMKNIHKKNLADMQPSHLKKVLGSLSYTFDDFVPLQDDYYDGLVREFCKEDQALLSQMERKRPSTGVITLVLGLAEAAHDRYVISGFSFELTHAYGHNPEIDDRGTRASAHAQTDIMILRRLGHELGNIYTTEPLVHEQTGLPLLPEEEPSGPDAHPARGQTP